MATSTSILDYVDVVPKCLEAEGVFTEAVYERFDRLILRANEWLRQRPQVRIVTCESVEFKQKSGSYVNPEKMSFYERGEHINRFVRGLRLWFRSRLPSEPPEPQHISYRNVVPKPLSEQGVFSAAKFEDLGATLDSLNRTLRQRPITGTIINVETQDMKLHSSRGPDPDECSWHERGKTGCHFVMVLRIFFVNGPPAYEDIGCADFVPERVGSDMERLSTVLAKARNWLKNQSNIRFINVQSIDYKLKHDWGERTLDTHRTTYFEQGKGYTRYVRIVRVYYGRTNPSHAQTLGPPPTPMPALNYKTFVPICLEPAGFGSPRYETMSKTWDRAKVWMRAAGVTNFLSVETVPVRLYSGRQHGNHEITYTRNHGNHNEYWLIVLRVYINGPYAEPPSAARPQAQQTDDYSCAIL